MFKVISLAGIIVAVCLLLHVSGVLVMAEMLLRHREYLEQKATKMQHAVLLMFLFAGIMVLHIAETCMWASFYYTQTLFKDFETSLYFSLTSFTTIGYGDVLLPERWRLLGAIEGMSGVLLCGISTAFMFAVISAMFQMRLRSPTA